ncbi:FlaD/FlaE family flagellar protein [Methanomethylovorans sp.]|uniref:FlaD/FlaE family flagellar protein n=1 Tax=Methanomethylovorans sp. TaxID=2758717 RepID=UPI00351BFC06
MSKFPWEQTGQKKEVEPNGNTNAAPGTPPFAAGAPIPDLFQKAFSEAVIQETNIVPLTHEQNSSVSPSAVSSPLFSMEMPDLNSLQSDQKTPNNHIPSFIMDGKKESLPPFLSPEQPMVFSRAPATEIKDPSKVQTAKKKPLPVFEMVLHDDVTNGSNSIFPPINAGNNVPHISTVSASGPNLGDPGTFSLPAFPPATENIASSPFSPQPPVFDGAAPSLQNAASASALAPPFPSLQASIPPSRPANISGSDDPFDPIPSNAVDSPFGGVPSPFNGPGSSPFSGGPLSADPFSTSNDPFVHSIAPSAADPFAGQGNPFGAGPVPFPPSEVKSPFPGSPFPGSVNSVSEKKTGISGKMAGVSGNLTTSISELATSIVANLRNLTKGKSLMEKMEKIREGNMHEDGNPLQLPDTSAYEDVMHAKSNASPFVSDVFPFGAGYSGSSPFAPSVGADPLSMPAPQLSQVGIRGDHAIGQASDDFIKVTPVENPLYDFPEELKIENNPPSSLPADGITAGTGEQTNGILKEPVSPLRKQENLTHGMSSLPASMRQRPSGPLYQPEKMNEEGSFSAAAMSSNGSASVGSKDLDDIREKLELFAANVSQVYGMFEELSGNVDVLGDSVRSVQSSSDDLMKATGMKFDNLDERVGQLESHLSGIEQQVAQVQSENQGIISSLSSIEQHISELVGSYTALVSKMQENAQENDERLSALSGKIGSMENLVPRLVSMERSGAEMSVAVQDMKDNVSKLAADVSSASASQQNIRDEVTELSRYAQEELKKIGARGYKVAGQSIQLTHIMKNSSSIKLCMEWLEFLMELVGRNNLPDILSYYEELGWITEEVRMELMRYAEGIDFYMEKPDWKLTPDDHVKSIWFIESLAGIKVDKNRLSVIDRDIEKVRKGSEIYNI